MTFRALGCAAIAALFTYSSASAQTVSITADTPSMTATIAGQSITIERVQDPDNELSGEFAKTSRPCPPFCISPMEAAPGVATVGELEVISFIEGAVAGGDGLLIDTRLPEWYTKGTIPGSVNVPFATLKAENPYRDQILTALGGVQAGDGWDFSGAKALLMFCNGPWCDQTPRAIKELIAVGYPADKLQYYRGGMQVWMSLGLSVARPNA